jgi:hypothetical protein
VINLFWGIIHRLAQPHPAASIFPRTTTLPEIPPAPLYQRGVGGDFRDGLTKKNFLENFKFSYFDRPRDESRTFLTKPNVNLNPIPVSVFSHGDENPGDLRLLFFLVIMHHFCSLYYPSSLGPKSLCPLHPAPRHLIN